MTTACHDAIAAKVEPRMSVFMVVMVVMRLLVPAEHLWSWRGRNTLWRR